MKNSYVSMLNFERLRVSNNELEKKQGKIMPEMFLDMGVK